MGRHVGIRQQVPLQYSGAVVGTQSLREEFTPRRRRVDSRQLFSNPFNEEAQC